MNKSAWWAWAVRNSICIICWTALAIIFNKWWIALFAGLFISTLQSGHMKQYYRICDNCGKHSPYADSYNEALNKAKEAGWWHDVNKNEDFCPTCQKQIMRSKND